MEEIIAREKQLKVLERIYNRAQPELVAVYGRRRIGKTFLINKFFETKGLFFSITGVKNAPLATQLRNFALVFSRTFLKGCPIDPPSNWSEAFKLLWEKIEESNLHGRIVLFFDEFPWLAAPRSGFLMAFDFFWNQYMSRDNRIIAIICGSAAAWMIRNVIHARGGLHGRVTQKIRLRPFTLNETERYLESKGVRLDRKRIVELYMGVGGVAQYLLQVEPGQSAAQAIEELCFVQDGYLTQEFYHIYASLFDNYELHVDIVRLLSNTSKPLSREAILEKLSINSGSQLTRALRELEESGLILGVPFFSKNRKRFAFQLIDPFTLFYLHWIEKSGQNTSGNHWTKLQQSPSWFSWAGHAFETVCMTHIEQIKSALGLSGVSTIHTQWSSRKSQTQSHKGAQIDLVIDRADGCINLCEIKFCKEEFTIDQAYAEALERKKNIFAKETKTRKSLFTTLITPYGANRNMHYLSSVQNDLTLKDLFGNSI